MTSSWKSNNIRFKSVNPREFILNKLKKSLVSHPTFGTNSNFNWDNFDIRIGYIGPVETEKSREAYENLRKEVEKLILKYHDIITANGCRNHSTFSSYINNLDPSYPSTTPDIPREQVPSLVPRLMDVYISGTNPFFGIDIEDSGSGTYLDTLLYKYTGSATTLIRKNTIKRNFDSTTPYYNDKRFKALLLTIPDNSDAYVATLNYIGPRASTAVNIKDGTFYFKLTNVKDIDPIFAQMGLVADEESKVYAMEEVNDLMAFVNRTSGLKIMSDTTKENGMKREIVVGLFSPLSSSLNKLLAKDAGNNFTNTFCISSSGKTTFTFHFAKPEEDRIEGDYSSVDNPSNTGISMEDEYTEAIPES